MENRYLRRVGTREFTLKPYAGLIGFFGGVMMFYGFAKAPAFLIAGPIFLVVALALYVAHTSRPSAVELRLLVDTGNVDEAMIHVLSQLNSTGDSDRKAELMLLLGRCAELLGDFDEAGGVYEAALARASGDAIDELRDRRAFCLAAAGNVEEARNLLGAAPDRKRPFRENDVTRRPLEVRARCITAFRSGEHTTVLDLVERSRAVVETELLPIDRSLVFALEHVAAASLGRTGARLAPLDAATTTWVGRFIPSIGRYIDGRASE